jgi:phage terminase large subunit
VPSARIEFPEILEPLFEQHRYKVCWGGRAGVKSWSFARALLILGSKRPLRILCTREVQNSIKDSVHKLLSDQIGLLGLGDFYDIQQATIQGRNGTEFIFAGLSTQTAESIKSYEGIDICWVEEANVVSEFSWKILIPTIRKEDSEIWISFNPDLEHDPAYQRFVVNPPKGAWVQKVTWRDNPWITQVLLDEMDHLKETDYQEYLHVWEGELKEIAENAIYGQQLLKAKQGGRICPLPVASGVPVHTFWDLGRNDINAIWFMQRVGPWYHLIDYCSDRLKQLDFYAQEIKKRDYLYGTHYLPHDASHLYLGMPISRKQQLEDMGVKPIEVVERVSDVMDGIEMTRKIFASCRFDEERCKEGLSALRNYVWSFDHDKQTYSRTPVHNWASNGADAFRQLAQGYKPTTERRPIKVNTNYIV